MSWSRSRWCRSPASKRWDPHLMRSSCRTTGYNGQVGGHILIRGPYCIGPDTQLIFYLLHILYILVYHMSHWRGFDPPKRGAILISIDQEFVCWRGWWLGEGGPHSIRKILTWSTVDLWERGMKSVGSSGGTKSKGKGERELIPASKVPPGRWGGGRGVGPTTAGRGRGD